MPAGQVRCPTPACRNSHNGNASRESERPTASPVPALPPVRMAAPPPAPRPRPSQLFDDNLPQPDGNSEFVEVPSQLDHSAGAEVDQFSCRPLAHQSLTSCIEIVLAYENLMTLRGMELASQVNDTDQSDMSGVAAMLADQASVSHSVLVEIAGVCREKMSVCHENCQQKRRSLREYFPRVAAACDAGDALSCQKRNHLASIARDNSETNNEICTAQFHALLTEQDAQRREYLAVEAQSRISAESISGSFGN